MYVILVCTCVTPTPPVCVCLHCSQLCLSGHLDHTQQGLDALPDMLSGHFSVDPMFLSNVSYACIYVCWGTYMYKQCIEHCTCCAPLILVAVGLVDYLYAVCPLFISNF